MNPPSQTTTQIQASQNIPTTVNLSELTSLPANPLTKLYQRPIKETIQTRREPHHKPSLKTKKKKKIATQPVKTQSNQTALSATTGKPNQPQPRVDPQSASSHQRPKSTTSSFLTPKSTTPSQTRDPSTSFIFFHGRVAERKRKVWLREEKK
jgi:hypothetical protein